MNIKEIACRVGVSSATISRILNNSGYMKGEIRQKVLKAVDEYNYILSTIVRNLSIQDSLSMGTIIPDIESKFFSKAISGISEVTESYHYNIVFPGTNETSEKEHDLLKIVESQRLRGIIITSILETDAVTRDCLLRLEESDIPVVLADCDVKGAQFDGIFADNQRGSYDRVMASIKAGHEWVAITTGPETSKPGKDQCQGYLQAMEDSGLSVPEEYVTCGDSKIARAYECTGRLLGLKGPPTTIFTSNNLSTPGCLKYLTEHKTKVGKGVSLVGFDDVDALRMIDYRISVVDRDAREQGGEVIGLLQECFEDPRKSCQRGKRIIIPYKVILRGSGHKKTT